MENSDKEQTKSSGVDRELLNLQPTNNPGLAESVASSSKSRRRRQSASSSQNICAELNNSIKQTISKWEDVQLPLLPQDEEKLRQDYARLIFERDSLVEASILLAEQLTKQGSIQEATEVREVAKTCNKK